MKYSGTGIAISVYDKSGNLVETRNVPWSQLGVSDSSTATSWKYQVPSTDGIYEYKISYSTAVDITDEVAPITVNNNVSGGGSNSGSGTSVPSGYDVSVNKTATKITAQEITWQYTITVPKTGFDKLESVDSFPNTYLGDKFLYDSLVPGSVSVAGLQGEETYSQKVTDKDLTLTFYKDSAKTKTGLNPTSDNRVITVTLKTKNNEEWIKAVSDGVAGSFQLTHTNNVKVVANHSEIHASAGANPPFNHEIDKKVDNAGTVNIGGVEYPVYQYDIVLSGVSSDNFSITDTFDTSLLRFYDPYKQDPVDYGKSEANKIFGGDQYGQYQAIPNKYPVFESTASGMNIHVTSDCLPKQASGEYYSRYRIRYYLVVKDAAALKKLKDTAAKNKGKAILDNTAGWEGSESKASIDYDYLPLDKRQVSVKNRTATYEVDLNKDGLDLDPNSDALTLKDVLSKNQYLDVTSIKADPSEGVSYDYDRVTNTLTVTFPDGKPVKLTYSATVEGAGNVQYSNTATLNGASKKVEQSMSISGSASGTASIPSIKLLKYTYGNIKETLPGAKFKLYRADNNQPVSDKIFESDQSGVVKVQGLENQDGWTLEEGTKYYLQEVQAPEGYDVRKDPIYFTISNNPAADKDEYLSASTIPFWNKKNNFTITKVDADDSSKELDGAEFTLTGTGAVADFKQTATTVKGKVGFSGLLPGTYKLTETKAPEGYDLDKTEYTVIVDNDLKVTSPQLTFTASGDSYGVQISNKRKGQPMPLPSVGGTGIVTMLSGGLGFLILAAGVEILRRRHETAYAVDSRVRSAHGRRA